MPSKSPSLLILTLIVFALMATGCSALDAPSPTTQHESPAPPTTEPSVTSPPEGEDPSEETSTPTAMEGDVCIPLDAELRAKMDELQDQVITLRGLQPIGPVNRILLTREELRQRLLEDFQNDYTQEEARNDSRVLALLGLLSPDFDLWNLYIDLYSEQIAGFYDDETKEMAIICGTGFGGTERDVFVHEYTHALQDQTYDLEKGLGIDDESCEADSERCYAIHALIEGDATKLETQWWQIYATEQDRADLLHALDTLDTPIFDSVPRFIREDLLFPYIAGRRFVDARYLDGGWAAVDAVYADPPLSTEQILHPEKYPHDTPVWLVVPELGDALGDAWVEIERNVLGEWSLQLTLNEFLPKPDAVQAAEGWGGDYYLAFHNDETDQDILILVTQWDKMRDVLEFAASFLDYADTRFGQRETSNTYTTVWEGDESYVLFERISNQTLWILAPDAETAHILRQTMSFPAPLQ